MERETVAALTPSSKTAGKRMEFSGWVEHLVYDAGEAEESRRRKVQFTLFSILVIPAGVIWGALYYFSGERTIALIPTAYSALTLVDFLMLWRTRRYQLYRRIQQILILLLPLALQI